MGVLTLASPKSLKVACQALGRADPTLRRHMKAVGPCTMLPPRSLVPFEALCSAIGHQQLNGTAAMTILGRFKDRFGGGRWPKAADVVKKPVSALRTVGLSEAKALAIKDLAQKVLDGTVPTAAELRRLSDEAIIERITEVRGIGRWTVEMLLMFRLGRLDVLPVDDFGVRKGFSQLYRRPQMVKPKALLQFGERWRPYRSVAAWYMWRVLDV